MRRPSPAPDPNEPGVGGDPLRVLHVIESFGGGSANAMMQFVRAVPEAQHTLLRAERPGEQVGGSVLTEFSAVHELPRNPLRGVLAVRRAVRSERPQVVHAHSSIAGAVVRCAVRSRRETRIVYSPHCFAFERRDLAGPLRAAFAAAEWLLALNTARVAACSERERRLAANLPARRPPVHVPNTAASVAAPAPPPSTARANKIVGLGRMSAQKDPAFFAEVVRSLRDLRPDVSATWIGGGPADQVAVLETEGISVTGWLGAAAVADELDSAAVYLHTAAWEGFPLAILEAASRSLPVVGRRIAALDGMPEEWIASDPAAAASKVDLALSPAGRAASISAWTRALAANSPQGQRRALLNAYQPLERRARRGALRTPTA